MESVIVVSIKGENTLLSCYSCCKMCSFAYRHTCMSNVLQKLFVCRILREYISLCWTTSRGTHMLPSRCKAWSGETEEIKMAILVGAIQDERTQTPEATQGL